VTEFEVFNSPIIEESNIAYLLVVKYLKNLIDLQLRILLMNEDPTKIENCIGTWFYLSCKNLLNVFLV